jgi:hypothetical protein
MRYFKITDLITKEEHFVSSFSTDERNEQLLTSAGLDMARKFRIEEICGTEFFGLSAGRPDPDTDDEAEDYTDEYYY